MKCLILKVPQAAKTLTRSGVVLRQVSKEAPEKMVLLTLFPVFRYLQ